MLIFCTYLIWYSTWDTYVESVSYNLDHAHINVRISTFFSNRTCYLSWK